jgi:hypothetical protein
MSDSPETDFGDLEALLRSAGNYVRPSDELRPRVLEKARTQQHEIRWIHWLWQGALALVVAGILLSQFAATSSAELDALNEVPPEASSAEKDHAHWHSVEALKAIRRRQATFFHWPL